MDKLNSFKHPQVGADLWVLEVRDGKGVLSRTYFKTEAVAAKAASMIAAWYEAEKRDDK